MNRAKRAASRGEAVLAPSRRQITRSAMAVIEEARRDGLLDGRRTERVSFRAPRALVEAAKRESGIASPTELGILALATLAQRDPVAAFLKRTHGRLGEAHTFD